MKLLANVFSQLNRGLIRFVHSFLVVVGLVLSGMQAQRRITHGVGLCLADLAIGQIGGVTADREAEMPEVDADLIDAAGDRPCLDQRAWPLAEVQPGE